jgi:hypothetical protein
MTNDTPVTDSELDAIYGTAPTQTEIGIAIGKAASDFEAYDLAEAASDYFEQIAEALVNSEFELVGMIVDMARRKRIANVASRAVYGVYGKIVADEVKV